jgi:ribosomal protein S18 acetylase RimI-like enzyme
MGVIVARDAWLSSVLDRPVIRVDATGLDPDLREDADSAMSALGEAILSTPRTLAYAKVPCDRVGVVSLLSRTGFATVDVNVTFEREPGILEPPSVEVTRAAGDDGETAAILAGRSFVHTRFHLDPRVGKAGADAVKREWVRSYARADRGDALLVARLGGRVVGFLAALSAGPAAVIDLVGVAQTAQGRGVGRALVSAFAAHYQGRAEKLRVGTQIANHRSVRLYESLGFRLVDSQYVLHAHHPEVTTSP